MGPLGRITVAALIVGILPGISHGARSGQSPAELRTQAFQRAYNLDHDEAVALLRQAVQAAPDDPATHSALASVLWLNILFKRGAITVDHYLGSFSRTQIELKKPPPELDAEFRKHADRAVQLAEQRVKSAPSDPRARYDLGAAVGLRASYVATVEGKMMAGFRGARRAYDEHERVLALDPSRKDAGLVVGTYRYIVSTLSFPMRMMAYVAGFGGGRERGIRMLEETAAFGGDSRTDAMFALILVYNRERRFDDALRVLRQLRAAYPRNRLVVLEEGATALRGERYQEADRKGTEGLTLQAKDPREKVPGEEALWRLKRGGGPGGTESPGRRRRSPVRHRRRRAAVGPRTGAYRPRAAGAEARRPGRCPRAGRPRRDAVPGRQRPGVPRAGAPGAQELRWPLG